MSTHAVGSNHEQRGIFQPHVAYTILVICSIHPTSLKVPIVSGKPKLCLDSLIKGSSASANRQPEITNDATSFDECVHDMFQKKKVRQLLNSAETVHQGCVVLQR